MDGTELLRRLARMVDEHGEAEDVRAFGVIETHVQRLESVAGAAVELVHCAPRSIARDAGDAGEAWDVLVSELEGVDNDLLAGAVDVRGQARGESSPPGATRGAPARLEVGALLSAAAAVQSQLDRVGDAGAQAAWSHFLDLLAEAWG